MLAATEGVWPPVGGEERVWPPCWRRKRVWQPVGGMEGAWPSCWRKERAWPPCWRRERAWSPAGDKAWSRHGRLLATRQTWGSRLLERWTGDDKKSERGSLSSSHVKRSSIPFVRTCHFTFFLNHTSFYFSHSFYFNGRKRFPL